MNPTLSLLTISTILVSCGGKTDDEGICDDTEFFAEDRVLQVAITMDDGDWDSLRHQSRSIPGEFVGDCRSGPYKGDYTYFPATIDIDGESASDIGIRKKGFIGSQSTEKPGFRINLDEYVDDTKLYCTDNITLNNSVQDPALIRQCLTYKVFRDAGLPAPRCNFARVSMNGKDLGIYVNVEPVKKRFLRQHFSDDDGDLYEGTITDFAPDWYSTFDVKTDETDATLSTIREVADAIDAGTDDLETILRRHFDFERLLTFLSAETWTGHWDGYGGNQNNFFVYRDPETDKMTFIPWGVDGTMHPEEYWFPTKGYLANQILRDEALSKQWYDKIGDLRSSAWIAEDLQAEINRMESVLATEFDTSVIEEALNEVRQFVDERERTIKAVLPVTEVDDFGRPFCMVERGFIDAEFSTTWTSEAPNLETMLATEGTTIDMSFDGATIDFDAAGAHAGPVEDGFGQVVMAGAFEGENGPAYALPVFYFEIEEVEPGSEIGLDWGGGSLLYMDETTGWEPINVGEFWNGAAHFDAASPVEAEAVTGFLTSGIYTWTEVDG